jgi:signal transduction histidine kinase
VLLAGFGVGLSGSFTHLVLGIGRQPNWKHLAFSATMAFACAYFLYERRFYAASTVEQGVEVARDQLWSVAGYLGAFAWFIRRYTGARFPRWLVWLFYASLVAALIYNQFAPWALYYSVRPELKVVHSFGNETLHTLAAPLGVIPLLWFLLNIGVQVTAVICGIRLARRDDLLSGLTFTIAVALPLLGILIDLTHELIGASWPYVSEYGAVGMVTVLSVQLAVDYRDKEAKLAHAFADLEKSSARISFLSESTFLLSASLDYERVLGSLASLVVRELADWCVIDVLEDGQLRRLSSAHADITKKELLDRLRDRFSPVAPAPAATVVSSRRPLLLSSVSDEKLRSLCRDDEHFRLIRALGCGSLVSVPLIARGEMLGVLTIVSAQQDRYHDEDRQLAEELAGRAALALDNARLYRAEQESVRGRDEFLTAASHELRTPIAALLLSVQSFLIGKEKLPERARQSAERILRQAERLAKLINDMLDVGAVHLGRLELHPTEVDLGAVVKDAVDRMGSSFSQASCDPILHISEGVRGQWDPEKLDQVVTNLLSNAMKFGAGKPVEVSVDKEPGGANLAVVDHGMGIAPEALPRIFGKFERAKEAMPLGGLGLGLYITRDIVSAMGGTIAVTSDPGRETRFTVSLPSGRSPQPGDAFTSLRS